MLGVDFASTALWINLALFGAGAIVVWIAGTKLAFYADALAERTGIGREFLGLVLLAGVTELPELVTSVSAVRIGDAPLAINNLFGGIVMQTAILAIADFWTDQGCLSFFTPKPELLLQGVLLSVLLAAVLAGVAIGEPCSIGGVGPLVLAVFVLYLVSLKLIANFEPAKHWRPVDLPDTLTRKEVSHNPSRGAPIPVRQIWIALGGISAAILVAGTLLVATGSAIATQTGLGSSFVGATILAATTSLPELSTTLGAIKLRAYGMAFANIFGSNAIMVALLFLTDLAYQGGPILDQVDRSATFTAAMGVLVTGIYVVGLIMRRTGSFLRMGVDSLLVLLAYALTLIGLYALRTN